ncbi:uncharacterized protein F5891DRAFT_940924 [Suillus fuscotomentosus]|uniref:Pheromone receptor n=1 Tax=Suillus fuscotomentosus TaxID=1912939 RepID=A0AAD4HR32_9AGAM|nr:uncharacterized protein F5891DRAFT_940924 [Suillus fuscotomentosus]KAG1906975.1 hypothetical protein F5891DRAFT_940924 [Suillus fuscotomentosus]
MSVPPPPGLNYLAAIQPALIDVMIGHTFTVILVPLLIAMFYFSNEHSRRQPIFILNILNVCLAFSVGIMGDSRAVNTMLSPTHPYPVSYDIIMGFLGAVQSILVDTILLFRICSVYPPRYLTWQRFVMLVSLPVLLKVARVINLSLFIAALTRAAKGPNAEATLAALWVAAPYLKIEWFAQLVDNIYASSVFLWTLWSKRKNNDGSTTGNTKFSFRMRLRTLFWIALSNFVIPALFSVAQIIVIYCEVNPVVINQIILANTSIAVIGVVFATVWAGTVNRQIAQSDAKLAADVEKSDMKASVMHFARGAIVTHDELHPTYQLPAISGSTDDEFGKIGSGRYGLPKSPL